MGDPDRHRGRLAFGTAKVDNRGGVGLAVKLKVGPRRPTDKATLLKSHFNKEAPFSPTHDPGEPKLIPSST